MKNKLLFALLTLSLLVSNLASAHVTVNPRQAGVGAFQTFTVSVPSEKDFATTRVSLALPAEITSVTPTVKPGWRVEVKNHDLPGGVKHPYEIVWSGGSIPGHFRDEFTFSTRVPTNATTLAWKAYQTYSDGSVVSWDLAPGDQQPTNHQGAADFSKVGPYSETKVVNDLNATPATTTQASESGFSTALVVSTVAFIFSLLALVISYLNKKRV